MRYPLGNDIRIMWSIEIEGYDSLPSEGLSLILITPTGRRVPLDFHISGTQLSAIYEGRHQRVTGWYNIELQLNAGGKDMHTKLRYHVFCLYSLGAGMQPCSTGSFSVELNDFIAGVVLPGSCDCDEQLSGIQQGIEEIKESLSTRTDVDSIPISNIDKLFDEADQTSIN